MNLLAHAYLSFHDPFLLTGNMISDYVKGRRQFDYPPAIQRGILLHRAIDQFTDQHPATQAAKAVFRPHYRLYAGACVDVVYDHFLANDAVHFPDEDSLKAFSAEVYSQLYSQLPHLPEPFVSMLPHMQAQNWLYHYRFRFGIERAFGGLVRRSAHLHDSTTAFRIFEEHYPLLEDCYRQFFPEVYQMAGDWAAC
jgi:acyl carrier protein phosphodiesterase